MKACGIDPDGADRHVSRPKIVKQRTQGKSRMKRSSRNYAEGESPRERIVNAASRLFGSKGFRSEEHTSELQSLMRISYAVFCLKKKNKHTTNTKQHTASQQ